MRTVCSRGLRVDLAVVAAGAMFLVAQGHQRTWSGEASSPSRPAGSGALVVAAEPISLDQISVAAGCVLIANNTESDSGKDSVQLQSLTGQSLEVPRMKVISLEVVGAPAALGGGESTSTGNEVPPLIRRQPQVVQDAWLQIAEAVVANQRLPRPRPEPLFARAELWMMVGNYDAALRDLLKAMRIASDTGVSARVYDAVFNRLREVLERYDVTPVPPEDGEPSRHYGHGVHSFWAGHYVEAEKAFANAISLAPSNPLYWYMRAVTRRRLGNEQTANHDALLGVAAERKACLRRDGVSLDINRELKRLQGSDRIWLEDHRRGDPSRRTMSGMQK